MLKAQTGITHIPHGLIVCIKHNSRNRSQESVLQVFLENFGDFLTMPIIVEDVCAARIQLCWNFLFSHLCPLDSILDCCNEAAREFSLLVPIPTTSV